MADVICISCSEPWASYHMREELWFDMQDQGRTNQECKEAREEFRLTGKIPGWARKDLERAGWELGTTVFAIKRCPGCKSKGVTTPPDPEKLARALMIEETLGGDTDGIQAMMEDLGG